MLYFESNPVGAGLAGFFFLKDLRTCIELKELKVDRWRKCLSNLLGARNLNGESGEIKTRLKWFVEIQIQERMVIIAFPELDVRSKGTEGNKRQEFKDLLPKLNLT